MAVSQTLRQKKGRRFYPPDLVRIVTKSNWHIVKVVFSLGNVMLHPETVKFMKILCCVYYGLPTKQNREKIWDKIIWGLLLISRTCSIEKAFHGGKKNLPKAQESRLHSVISLRTRLAFQRDGICRWNIQLPERAWPPSSGKSSVCISRGSSFLGQHECSCFG